MTVDGVRTSESFCLEDVEEVQEMKGVCGGSLFMFGLYHQEQKEVERTAA